MIEHLVIQRFLGMLYDRRNDLATEELIILATWVLEGLPDPLNEPLGILASVPDCTFKELQKIFSQLVQKGVLKKEGPRFQISDHYKERFKNLGV